VNIMQWRAAFQKDIDDGHAPSIAELYPYAWTDVYPDELLGASLPGDTAGDTDAVVLVGSTVVDDHRELVAAEPGDRVGGPHRLADPPRDSPRRRSPAHGRGCRRPT